jgi:hypothetical protein
MSPFFFNSFFILVQYTILKLNVRIHPPECEKDTKIFVWNCALHSSSGVVFDCCGHAHKGSCTRTRRGEKHCLSRSADPGVLAEGSFFFFYSAFVVLIDLFAQIKTRRMYLIFK